MHVLTVSLILILLVGGGTVAWSWSTGDAIQRSVEAVAANAEAALDSGPVVIVLDEFGPMRRVRVGVGVTELSPGRKQFAVEGAVLQGFREVDDEPGRQAGDTGGQIARSTAREEWFRLLGEPARSDAAQRVAARVEIGERVVENVFGAPIQQWPLAGVEWRTLAQLLDVGIAIDCRSEADGGARFRLQAIEQRAVGAELTLAVELGGTTIEAVGKLAATGGLVQDVSGVAMAPLTDRGLRVTLTLQRRQGSPDAIERVAIGLAPAEP